LGWAAIILAENSYQRRAATRADPAGVMLAVGSKLDFVAKAVGAKDRTPFSALASAFSRLCQGG
jgi:hypothetical protein